MIYCTYTLFVPLFNPTVFIASNKNRIQKYFLCFLSRIFVISRNNTYDVEVHKTLKLKFRE